MCLYWMNQSSRDINGQSHYMSVMLADGIRTQMHTSRVIWHSLRRQGRDRADSLAEMAFIGNSWQNCQKEQLVKTMATAQSVKGGGMNLGPRGVLMGEGHEVSFIWCGTIYQIWLIIMKLLIFSLITHWHFIWLPLTDKSNNIRLILKNPKATIDLPRCHLEKQWLHILILVWWTAPELSGGLTRLAHPPLQSRAPTFAYWFG